MRRYSLYDDIIDGNHVLIAGKTGSGKSVLLNNIICHIASFCYPYGNGEESAGLVLIDPKRVEFSEYAGLPHVLSHATSEEEAVRCLSAVVGVMENRYMEMEKQGIKTYADDRIYVIIDEFADFSGNTEIRDLVDRISRLGRAAGMHLIIATQRPAITDKSVSASTRANLDTRIALRCAEAKDSRMIIGCAGAEELPKYGSFLMSCPMYERIQLCDFEPIPGEEKMEILGGWNTEPEPARKHSVFSSIIETLDNCVRHGIIKPTC